MMPVLAENVKHESTDIKLLPASGISILSEKNV
jgi:hypothetical protein